MPSAYPSSNASRRPTPTPSDPALTSLNNLITENNAFIEADLSKRNDYMSQLDGNSLIKADAEEVVERRRELTVKIRGLHRLLAQGMGTVVEARKEKERILKGEEKKKVDEFRKKPKRQEVEGCIGDEEMYKRNMEIQKHYEGDQAEVRFYEMLEE